MYSDYKTLATRSTDWTLSNGKRIEVTVSLRQEWTGYFERDLSPKPYGLDIAVAAALDGKDLPLISYSIVELPEPQGEIVARIGNIGLTQERADAIRRMRSEVESHPAYVEQLANMAANRESGRKIDQDNRRLESIMTLGGSSK